VGVRGMRSPICLKSSKKLKKYNKKLKYTDNVVKADQ
jgi:hypothetical protein